MSPLFSIEFSEVDLPDATLMPAFKWQGPVKCEFNVLKLLPGKLPEKPERWKRIPDYNIFVSLHFASRQLSYEEKKVITEIAAAKFRNTTVAKQKGYLKRYLL